MKSRKTRKLLLKTWRKARNLHSRKQKKCNLCWEDLFGCKQRKKPGRKKSQWNSPKKMIQFLLTFKRIQTLNILENLVKHSKQFWTEWEDWLQDSLELRQTLLSATQVWFGGDALWSLSWDRNFFISGCCLSTGMKRIDWSDSICSLLSRRKANLGNVVAYLLEESDYYQVGIQKRKNNSEGKLCRCQARLVYKKKA